MIEEVLQDTSTAPFPFNHAPLSMKPEDMSVKEFGDKASVYCYNLREEPVQVADANSEKGACVRHIFTGPYADPKVQATDLFYRIQEGVELSWQGVKMGIAEGTGTDSTWCFRQNAHVGFRAVLLLGVTPTWLDERGDARMHLRSKKTDLPIR